MKNLCFQGWIKTNFDVVKLRTDDSFKCCGSIAVGDGYKIEIKLINFQQLFESPFSKGDHVEVTGIMKNYYGRAMIMIDSIDAVKIIDGCKMFLSLLIKSNKEIKFQNQEEFPFKKQRQL
ncbi:hypothetical protein KQX54_012732 [Cotesia glomerata]|uniref:Uncharacterized protein n=1 Tax=Cotesia glomerata TaxID=32391 RepID=A0AAV7HYU2_COTGL|nr:hypothetical protein KQX54_012732 [Cotesia glomerata]